MSFSMSDVPVISVLVSKSSCKMPLLCPRNAVMVARISLQCYKRKQLFHKHQVTHASPSPSFMSLFVSVYCVGFLQTYSQANFQIYYSHFT
jgi:hypothetical protein